MLLILVGVVSFSALAAPAQDTGGGGDDVMIVKCEPFIVDFVLPPNGASDVSPDAVPAASAVAECGSGMVLATLTGPGAEVQTSLAEVLATGVVWFDTLRLEPDGNYLLDVQSGYGDEASFYAYGGLTSSFSTGSGEVVGLEGTPSVEILGSDFDAEAGWATVSLQLHPAGGAGDVWELLRGATVVGTGTSTETQLVDGTAASAGREICYTFHEYTADGELAGIAEPACVTVEGPPAGVCACSAASPARSSIPAGAALLAGVVMIVGRRRGPA